MKVLKFGGMTLENTEKIKSAAAIVQSQLKSQKNLIVVVSAMGKTTNELIQLANKVSSNPPARELDMLLSVGERISMSLMSIALHDLGISSVSLTGSQAGILTTEEHFDAQILEVKPVRIVEELTKKQVIIIAGFQGVSAVKKEITTLGRGGSDITAVAFAARFDCPCVILKEVPGIMSADPEQVPNAFLIHEMDYASFVDITKHGAKVVNSRAAEYAAKNNVTVEVQLASAQAKPGTVISKTTHFSRSDFTLSIMTSTDQKKSIRVTSYLTKDDLEHLLKTSPNAQSDSQGISILLKTDESSDIEVKKKMNLLYQQLVELKNRRT
ncbi:MAG: hypothetical protein ACK5P5_14125 [Pseudobdellovibrionaceae bacterium]